MSDTLNTKVIFFKTITICLSKYFDFKGRATRAEYWWFALFNFIVSILAGLIDYFLSIPIFFTLVSLALLFPFLTVVTRRLHDVNRSGWWQLFFIPLALLFKLFSIDLNTGVLHFLLLIAQITAITLSLGFFVLFFIWLVSKGTDGPNKYGESSASTKVKTNDNDEPSNPDNSSLVKQLICPRPLFNSIINTL